MKRFGFFFIFTLFMGSMVFAEKPHHSAELTQGGVKHVRRAVADWQMKHFYDSRKIKPGTSTQAQLDKRYDLRGWVYGTFYPGMMEWAKISNSGKYMRFMKKVGRKNKWQMAPRIYDADDYVVGQTYLDLFEKYKDKRMIAPLRAQFDKILEDPPTGSLYFPPSKAERQAGKDCRDRWCWCDALFMGPPTWVELGIVTGENKYIHFANKEFWATTEYLYDKSEGLYYRDSRYFNEREPNGRKVFWSRGNGWVFGGIARILEHLPADHPSRAAYVQIFQQMAKSLAKVQQRDGFWRASLLDPNKYTNPETSGTGFFVFGFAWGINNGVLDRDEYMKTVQKGWSALVSAVHKNGKLGWVQPIGKDPKSANADGSELYGPGSFLLAGAELYRLTSRP
ncbi:MAG: glycoside hydrolase family 88/105 protein [Parvibaculales bacterium]